jgi:hypothetical protein
MFATANRIRRQNVPPELVVRTPLGYGEVTVGLTISEAVTLLIVRRACFGERFPKDSCSFRPGSYGKSDISPGLAVAGQAPGRPPVVTDLVQAGYIVCKRKGPGTEELEWA